jgi:hypothetical protein
MVAHAVGILHCPERTRIAIMSLQNLQMAVKVGITIFVLLVLWVYDAESIHQVCSWEAGAYIN